MVRLLKEKEQGISRAVVSGPHNGTMLFTARLERHGEDNPQGHSPAAPPSTVLIQYQAVISICKSIS
jgi:hypothetical protein